MKLQCFLHQALLCIDTDVAECDLAKGEKPSKFAMYIETEEIDILNNEYTKQITQPW